MKFTIAWGAPSAGVVPWTNSKHATLAADIARCQASTSPTPSAALYVSRVSVPSSVVLASTMMIYLKQMSSKPS
eukprot:scaffold36284_cov137-Isochrysis_galbana.AAC.1